MRVMGTPGHGVVPAGAWFQGRLGSLADEWA